MKLHKMTCGVFGTMLLLSCCGTNLEAETEKNTGFGLQPRSDSLFIAQYPFVAREIDTLYDPAGSMVPFFGLLRKLEDSVIQRVNVIHFGDSHLQSGAMAEVIMQNLHDRFGNAGRGMVVPHKLSGSNEPRDYSIRSKGGYGWNSMRINNRAVGSVGITGVAVQSQNLNNRILICALPAWDKDEHGNGVVKYGFNRVRIFHSKYAPILEAEEMLSAGISAPDVISEFNTDIDLIREVDSLELTLRAEGDFARGAIYGFCLENGKPGILYHALGVNSACYVHWAKQPEVITQSVALEPDLIIVSLGSNEAAGGNFIDQVFYNEVDRFVRQLREANPKTSILLTAPAEAFKRGNPNQNFGRISKVLKRYAEEKGVAFLDVFEITGGAGSARQWAEYKLMGRDRIHFTNEGYRIQGLLIYRALEKGYMSFVPCF